MRGAIINDLREKLEEVNYDPALPVAPLADGSPSVVPIVQLTVPGYDFDTQNLVPIESYSNGQWVKGFEVVNKTDEQKKDVLRAKLANSDIQMGRVVEDIIDYLGILNQLPPSVQAKINQRKNWRSQL